MENHNPNEFVAVFLLKPSDIDSSLERFCLLVSQQDLCRVERRVKICGLHHRHVVPVCFVGVVHHQEIGIPAPQVYALVIRLGDMICASSGRMTPRVCRPLAPEVRDLDVGQHTYEANRFNMPIMQLAGMANLSLYDMYVSYARHSTRHGLC